MAPDLITRIIPANATKLLSVAAIALVVAGCAAGKTAKAPVFFPPLPNPPRIQFLMGISDSSDVMEKKSTLSTILSGDEPDGKPIGKPYGVTTGNGKIYVADSGINTVQIIDLKNKTFEYLKGDKKQGKLKKPINLTLDSSGNLYVADTSRKEILMYDVEGNFVKTYGKELQMKPVDVAIDNEFIFALDIKNNEIKVISRKNGELVRTIGKEALSIPTNMTMDANNFLYVTNVGYGNVAKLDKDGHLIATFGKLGDLFGEFARPRGVSVDHQGRIYVADAQFYNVQIFNETGRLLMFFGDPGVTDGSMNLPAGVTTTKDNLDYFQKLAAPGFILDSIVIVTNQYGNSKVAIYGLGEMKGGEKQGDGGALEAIKPVQLEKQK